jgi:hypothetical protein
MHPLAFISYRRQDSGIPARWLGETLQTTFGSASVFIDTDAIRVGDDWPRRLEQTLDVASTLIAVIGPNWLRISDMYGRRRLDQEDDWVRREMVHAMGRRLLMIPVLVSGGTLPAREALPVSLVPLLDVEAMELRDKHWETDRSILVDRLRSAGFRSSESAGAGDPPQQPQPLPEFRRVVIEQQIAAAKRGVSLVGQARNQARDIAKSFSADAPIIPGSVDTLRGLHLAIEKLLYDERALIPEEVFACLHFSKHAYLAFLRQVDKDAQDSAKPATGDEQATASSIQMAFQELDAKYAELLKLVRDYLGIG